MPGRDTFAQRGGSTRPRMSRRVRPANPGPA